MPPVPPAPRGSGWGVFWCVIGGVGVILGPAIAFSWLIFIGLIAAVPEPLAEAVPALIIVGSAMTVVSLGLVILGAVMCYRGWKRRRDHAERYGLV